MRQLILLERGKPMRVLTIAVVASLLLGGCSGDGISKVQRDEIAAAEKFIDAFYSFDRTRLEPLLAHTEQAVQKEILYYQGWAEGGNYKITNRKPCARDGAGKVNCPVGSLDALMPALSLPVSITDTFHLTFTDGNISKVETSSNDMDVYGAAQKWVFRTRPDLVGEPCRGFFEGGPTPQQCAQAMAQGYAAFRASDEFPTDPESFRLKPE